MPEEEKTKGIWTQISLQEHAALQMLCTKRGLKAKKRIPQRKLLRDLLRAEIRQAIEIGEIDPSELELTLADFE